MKTFFKGFLIGIADLIPGVSGGTLAYILGLYTRLMNAVDRFNFPVAWEGIRHSLFFLRSSRDRQSLLDFLHRHDFAFLVLLLLGDVTAILVLAPVFEYLLTFQREITFSFFVGLILFSLNYPLKSIKKMTVLKLFSLVLGAIFVVYIGTLSDPVAQFNDRSNFYQRQLESGSLFHFDHFLLREVVYLFLSGVLAASAAVLPGISGSLVLVLLGKYFIAISAISNLRVILKSGFSTIPYESIVYLLSLGFGVVFGLIFFTKLFKRVYERYMDVVTAFLIGLMVGSIYVIWPFRVVNLMDGYIKTGGHIEYVQNYPVYTNQIVSFSDLHLNASLYLCLLFFFLGGGVMFLFGKKRVVG